MRSQSILAFSFSIVTCSAVAAAASEATETPERASPAPVVEELILLETPQAQERGELQITLETMRQRVEDEREWGTSLALEYGVGDRLQVAVELPYHELRGEEGHSRGLGDAEIGLLYGLVSRESLVLSTALDATLPVGDEDLELGEGKVAFEPSLRVGAPVGPVWLFGSLGTELASGEPNSFEAGCAVAAPLGRRFVALLEVSQTAGAEPLATLSPGLVWKTPWDLELALGVPFNGWGAGPSGWGVHSALTLEF